MHQCVCMCSSVNRQSCRLSLCYSKTQSDKALTQESCSQSIWKYDCPSKTNQGLSKANSWTIAQAQDGKKKKKKPPSSSKLKWKRGNAERRKVPYLKEIKMKTLQMQIRERWGFVTLPREKCKLAALQSLSASYIKEFSSEKQSLCLV